MLPTVKLSTSSADHVSEVMFAFVEIFAVAPLSAVAKVVVWSNVIASKSPLSVTVTLPILAPVTVTVVKSSLSLIVNAPPLVSAVTVNVSRLDWAEASIDATIPPIVAVVKSVEANTIAGPAVSAGVSKGSLSNAPVIFAVTKSAAAEIVRSTAPSIVNVSTPAPITVLPINPETLTVATLVKVNTPSPMLALPAEAGPSNVKAYDAPTAVPAAFKSSRAVRAITPPFFTWRFKPPVP